MKALNFILVNTAALVLSISCSGVVETDNTFEDAQVIESSSGDMQGALVQLTGTVTEVEDVDSKEKKLGLSLDGEEIVVLKTDDPKAYVKGELLKVKAKLIDKLANNIRVFKPIEVLKQCLSKDKKPCFKPPFMAYPVVLKGVLHKIQTESDKEILTLVKDDKVLQLADVDDLLEDKKEGDEIAVAGYFKSKFSSKVIFKTLVVKKLIEAEGEPVEVVKELEGRFVKAYSKSPVFLTDAGKIIKLAKYDGKLFLGENARVKLKFVKVPMDVKKKVTDLMGDFLGKFSIFNKMKLNKKLALVPFKPTVVVAHIESVEYENCSEESQCSEEKIALLGYYYKADKDILFVGPDYKVELELAADKEYSAEADVKSKAGKKLVVVTGEFKEKILVADDIDYLSIDVWKTVEGSLDFLKKRDWSFWAGLKK